MGIDAQVTHHVVVHDFMNLNALKIILKIHKKIIKKDPGLILTQMNLHVA